MSRAQLTLFAEKKPRKPKPAPGLAPSEDELGLAVLWACGAAVHRRYIGEPPHGMDLDEIASIIIPATLKKVDKWRSGGPKDLQQYAYLSACHALTQWLRDRAKAAAKEEDLDVLDMPNVISIEQLRQAV